MTNVKENPIIRVKFNGLNYIANNSFVARSIYNPKLYVTIKKGRYGNDELSFTQEVFKAQVFSKKQCYVVLSEITGVEFISIMEILKPDYTFN